MVSRVTTASLSDNMQIKHPDTSSHPEETTAREMQGQNKEKPARHYREEICAAEAPLELNLARTARDD